MKFTDEQLKKAKQTKTVEEFLSLAKENHVALTEEEASKYFAELHKKGELTDEELANVSGGSCDDDVFDWINSVDVSYNPTTRKYFCPNCDDGNHQLSYYGYDYDGGDTYGKYKCESCGNWYKQYTSGSKNGKWFKM